MTYIEEGYNEFGISGLGTETVPGYIAREDVANAYDLVDPQRITPGISNELIQYYESSNDSVLTLRKPAAQTQIGNILGIYDYCNDGDAPVYIYGTVNNADKSLVHVELAGTEANTLYRGEANTGTLGSLMTLHAKDGMTAVTDVAYLENDTASGNCIHAWNDSASNTDPTGYFRTDGVQSTNYYKIFSFDGAGSVQLNVWIANNADPNGNLTDVVGSICLSTNGNIYRCTGTNNWVAM